jgi:hypothetical protein
MAHELCLMATAFAWRAGQIGHDAVPKRREDMRNELAV